MFKRSEVDKIYRKINDRMQKLYETFGMDNASYQEYASVVSQNFEITIKPDGRVQVRTGKVNADINKFQRKALENLLQGGETVGSLRRAARKYAKEHGLGESNNIDELVQKMDYVKNNRDLITYISEQVKQGVAITDSMRNLYNRAAGRSDELSYDELFSMMSAAMEDYNEFF